MSRSKVSRVLRSLEELAKKEFVPSVGPIKGRIISDVIRKYKAKNILEIGTLHGYSAILMAAALPSDGKVVTIELDKSIADIARKNIADAELSYKIDVRVGNALEVISNLDLEFDLLFLDAAKNEYLKYLKLAEKKSLKEGAIIVADNVEVSKNEMLDYLHYVRTSRIYKSYTIETTLEFTPHIKDAIEVSIKVA
ncbi:MAG: tRNA (adenine(22)-N(1))-methyltransferase TrmK [Thermoproteota archaeon]|nr:tRNA (adenine(22)-N(1))-methyltransferase TrmK [Thermoproteota archaeon]